MRELAKGEDELKSLRGLLDAIPQPVWLRDRDGTLGWANEAYLRAVEATDAPDARARGLELLDRADRDESARRRAAGGAYAARVAAVVAGARRRMLDVTESATPAGSAGIAIDISDLDRVRNDLQRQMEAHARTLDQLPTAVAIFDGKQRLAFHNAAYRQLWDLDQAFLDPASDGEILDRLRAARKLPEQADFRSWKAGLLSPTGPSSRRRAGGTCPTGGRSGSSPTRTRRAASPTSSTTSPSASISRRSTTP